MEIAISMSRATSLLPLLEPGGCAIEPIQQYILQRNIRHARLALVIDAMSSA
jgi:hypothetical protein